MARKSDKKNSLINGGVPHHHQPSTFKRLPIAYGHGCSTSATDRSSTTAWNN